MKIVYIAHPISGDVPGNLAKVMRIVRDINLNHPEIVPFAPYWLDCHALDDSVPLERFRGICNDTEYFNRRVVDELWLFGDTISGGMKHEISLALRNEIPIIPKSQETREAWKKYWNL